MRANRLVRNSLSWLAFPFVIVSLVLAVACDDRECAPTRANVDRQIRPLLERALNAKLVVATMSIECFPPDGSWVREMGNDYYVEGELSGPSQTVESLVNVVQSLGAQKFESGVVGNTSIVIFEGLSIEGGPWNGSIQAHPRIVRWHLER